MKKAKKILALLLALCMLIGLPMAVQANDSTEEFKIVSVEEAPDNSAYLSALGVSDDTIAAYKGRMVIVTFNSKPSDEMLTALNEKTITARILMTGSIKRAQDNSSTDNMGLSYLGKCEDNAILFGYSNVPSNNLTFYKHFDILRSTTTKKDDVNSGYAMGLVSCKFWFPTTNDFTKLTNESNVELSNPSTQVTVTQHPFRITNVAPMPTALAEKIGASTAGYTWLVEFNDDVDKDSIANNNIFRLRGYTIKGTQVDNITPTFDSALSAKLSDNQLAFTSATNRPLEHFHSTAMTKDETGCYGVASFALTTRQNSTTDDDNIVDGLCSIHGKTLGYSTATYDTTLDVITSDRFSSAAIGETMYASFAEALDVAKSGDTITLMGYSDMTSDTALVIPSGVTVDLNGFSVKANNLMSFGDLIDTRDGVSGGVIIDKDMTTAFTVLQPDNTALPLYDSTDKCYRFYNYDFKSAGPRDATENSVAFGAQLVFTNTDAYDLLAAGDGVEIEMNLAVTKNEKTTNFSYAFTQSLLTTYKESWMNPNRDTSKTPTMVLTVSGIAGISEISCTPSICSTSTFVRDVADAKTHTVVE